MSFLVDARGGAMTGHRHWGMRVIIPPAAVQQPTRIQCRCDTAIHVVRQALAIFVRIFLYGCRYTPLSAVAYPPPFMEREALASRVIDVSPAGERFHSPVLIEIPHFASPAQVQPRVTQCREVPSRSFTIMEPFHGSMDPTISWFKGPYLFMVQRTFSWLKAKAIIMHKGRAALRTFASH